MTRKYFEEEMRYLHEAGKVFAETYPEQARYLNIESISDRDPYVERLFEGFAFLAGKVHERLDDELPEYAESLLHLIDPDFLRPVPAMSLVEFSPEPGALQSAATLPRGTELVSDAVGEDEIACRFQTSAPATVRPIRLENAKLHWLSDGTSKVTIHLALEDALPLSELQLDELRLYFYAEPRQAARMYLHFTQHVRSVTARAEGTGEQSQGQEHNLGQDAIAPGGFRRDERLLPRSKRAFSGFRLLQEYLCFRQKFWCVDVKGLDRLEQRADEADAITLIIYFDKAYPEEHRFSKENVRLHCVPVINLFEQDADPIRVDHERSEYQLLAGSQSRHSYEVYDVQKVVGREARTGKTRVYQPLYGSGSRQNGSQRRYSLSQRIGPSGRFETYIRLNHAGADGDIARETVSVDLRCTNGTLPREYLQEHSIHEFGSSVPYEVQPDNLLQPTLILYPPHHRHDDLVWQFIAHRSLNYRTVADREVLVGLLELYDWSKSTGNRRRREGIRNVTWRPKEVLDRGAIKRGAEVVVEIEDDHFMGEGDVCVFGEVLSRFLSLYATINSFVHLTIEMTPSGTTYQWTPANGQRHLV